MIPPRARLAGIRILLVDDHALVRSGIRALLEVAGARVVAEAGRGEDAIEVSSSVPHDVVLLDVALPDVNGIVVASSLRRARPDTPILMLSMHAASEYQRRSHAVGAKGYVLKDTSPSELFDALEAVLDGRSSFCGAEAPPPGDPPEAGSEDELVRVGTLSPREREVLRLIAEGKSSTEIGILLRISARTVDSHRLRLMQKLRIHTIAGLTRFAVRNGMCALD